MFSTVAKGRQTIGG